MSNRKSFESVYLKEYRKRNPEKQEQWRISSEIRHLESCGYTVIQQRKQPEQMTVEELESHITQVKQQDREAQKRWKEKNKEHLRQYHRQYRKDHPTSAKVKNMTPEELEEYRAKRREYTARWRATHREQIREYSRNYYAAHSDKLRESQRKWRAKNPGYEKLRWQRYKDALEKARKEQQARIRRERREAKRKGVSNND